ncbi:MAG: DUF1552 domain-containing protein [Planctomycetota bacterium]
MNRFTHPITRRTALRSAATAVSLPLLESLPASAGPTRPHPTAPKRVIYLYFPNGVAEGVWGADRVGRDGRIERLNKWMSPFEPFRDELVIARDTVMPLGGGHDHGASNWLTSLGWDGPRSRAAGVSADQVAAKLVGGDTLLPSLELSLEGEGFFSNSLPRNVMSWSASGAPLPRETEPRAVYDRMFAPPGGGLADRSVLDDMLAEARALRQTVNVADRARVDEYLDSIRALERRIDFAEEQSRATAADGGRTDTFAAPKPGIPTSHGEYVRQMLDLVVLALKSDATRVVSFMLDHGQSNRYFDFLDGVRGTWHALSHYRDASGRTEDDDGKTRWRSVSEKRAMYATVNRWHHEQVAYLLRRLKEVREPGGKTLFDNTLIVYGSSLADGHRHGDEDLPTLVFGGAGGPLRGGYELRSRRPRDLASVHLGVLRQLSPRVTRFGRARTPLPGLFD